MVDILLRGTNLQLQVSSARTDLHQTRELPGTLMDWVLSSEGLSEEEELATAVRVAIGTDALASITDVLPDPDSTDRRGWWGDLDAEEIWNGWPIGCKNWLLMRAKIADANSVEGATVMRAEQYTRAALQPFLDRKIASAVSVKAQRVGRQEIDVFVTMYRGPLIAIQLRFAYLWDQVVVS
jgi:phage gp46-like protein